MFKAIYNMGLAGVVRDGIIVVGIGVILLVAYLLLRRAGADVRSGMVMFFGGICGVILAMFILAALSPESNGFTLETVLFFRGVMSQHGFIYYMPTVFLLGKIMKKDARLVSDIGGICLVIHQAICAPGCLFTGCCHGYPLDWGVQHPVYDFNYFPIQLVDGVFCLTIAYLLFRYLKRKNYNTGGVICPVMLVVYGLTKLLVNYGKTEGRLYGIFSYNQLHCLFSIAAGLLFLLIITMYNKEKNERQRVRAARAKHK